MALNKRLRSRWRAMVIFLIAYTLVSFTMMTLDSSTNIRIFIQFKAFSKMDLKRSKVFQLWKNEEKYCKNQGQNTSVDDILCIKPFKFLANFKNPCWKEMNLTIKCLPYFMLIGMDKSGTTDLYNRLIKHPEIRMNSGVGGKETTWWSWRRYGLWLNRVIKRQDLNDYIAYFDDPAAEINHTANDQGYHNLITGDGSPMDMWDFRGWPQIPQNLNKTEPEILTPHLIRHLYPQMKFIIILRNPIDRLYSDYLFLNLSKQTPDAFNEAVNTSLLILNTCYRINSFRKCLYDANLHHKWNAQARIHLGFYYVYLLEWFEVFPRHQFIVLRTEDLSKDISNYMLKVYQFLGTEELSMKQMNDLGILSKEHIYKTKEKQNIAPMSTFTREKLLNLYAPFNNKLAEMLDDPRFLWKNS